MRRRVLAAALLLALAAVRASAAGVTSGIELTIAARTLQPGELVVLTITSAETLTNVRVRLFDKDLVAFATTDRVWMALAGIDLDQKPGRYLAAVEARGGDGPLRASRTLVVQPKKFPTRRLQVNPSFVNPSAAELARIQEDAAFVRRVFAQPAGDRLWSGTMVRPVPDAATSRFGSRSIFNGEPRSPHGGADFLSPAGRPIGAPLAGRIVAARDSYFTGKTVIVDHGLGLFSLMAHLSEFDVQEGDMVAPGQRLGLVGATGRVTGPHLHWALTVSGARVDPLSALQLLGRE